MKNTKEEFELGQIIGKCVFISRPNEVGNRNATVTCSCGKTFTSRISRIKTGIGCGCEKGNMLKKNPSFLSDKLLRHGYTKGGHKSEYNTWVNIRARCFNKKHKSYHDYGARGISVCERWLKFDDFIADIGDKPSPKHSIERKDNNGNYEPDNCKWATKTQQARNKRSNRVVEHDGKKKCLSEWGEIFGLSRKLTIKKLKTGQETY